MAKKLTKKEKWEGFLEHGLEITRAGDDQFQGICPFCGKDKFYFNPVTLLWDCKVCGDSGNFEGFLHKRAPTYREFFKGEISLALARDRGIKPQTFTAWGFGFSPENQWYTIPQDGNPTRQCGNIHRYQIGKRSYATTGGGHELICPLKLHNSKRVWILEGEWDGPAWYEVLRSRGILEDVFVSPGAGAFPKSMADWFSGKEVVILFDFDDPGMKGAKRTGNLLAGIVDSIKYLNWPRDSNLSDGYDIRDLHTGRHKVDGKPCLCNAENPVCSLFDLHRNPKLELEFILENLRDTPPEISIVNNEEKPDDKQEKSKYSGEGVPYEKVLTRYQEWLHLNNPEVLEVLFGSAFANRIDVDPLWLFFVAPPGGSKTELLMSLSDAPKMASTTSITPPALISGQNTGAGGDPSLIPKLNGKTLIIKDFTTILNLNVTARDEIFGILRDCYDGKTEKYFGNGIHRKYISKFGILAGVTPAIEGFASMSSVLGERFIKYKIKQVGKIKTGEEVILRALMNITKENKMREALKEIGNEVLSKEIKPEDIPEYDEATAIKVRTLGMFVAALRGVVAREKYTGQVAFKPVAEIGTRLSKQLMTLAIGISIYKGEKVITEQTLRTVYQVGKDTAPDRVEEIVKQLYIHHYLKDSPEPDGWYSTNAVAEWTRLPAQTIGFLLEDLHMLHITNKKPNSVGQRGWKLSHQVLQLMDSIGLYDKEKTHSLKIRGKA